MKLFRTTKHQADYWRTRKIDWKVSYQDTWNHPHRFLISGILKTFDWYSLMEIGCGAGANLLNITKTIGNRQLGGTDINADAIELCNQTFKGGMFKVGSGDDVMMSDKSTDITLTDMYLIYIGKWKIKKYLTELKRITRKRVVLCEFYSPSWWDRFKIKVGSGYNAHDYVKLLKELNFYDIIKVKIPSQAWPGGGYQGTYGYVITAKVPKRG